MPIVAAANQHKEDERKEVTQDLYSSGFESIFFLGRWLDQPETIEKLCKSPDILIYLHP